MGDIVVAECDCGYQTKNLGLGGGMQDFTTYCGFPYLCLNCREVTVANFLDAEPSCRSCGSRSITAYNAEPLMGERENGVVFNWYINSERGELTLPEGTYLCPKCERKTLRFLWAGMFD